MLKVEREMSSKTQFIVPCLLLCTLLLNGCASLRGSGEAKPLKEVGTTPTEKKKADLLKQIDRKFENPQAHFELGQLYQADGLWTQAEREYNTALGFDPVHRDAQAALVKVFLDSGDTTRAQFSYDMYINQTSNTAFGSLKLALGFQKQGLDDYALACYQQALRLNPNSAKINRQIGYYYLSKGERDRARDYLTRSFQLKANQPDVAGELGRLGVPVKIPRKTAKKTKQLDKTVEEYDKRLTQ